MNTATLLLAVAAPVNRALTAAVGENTGLPEARSLQHRSDPQEYPTRIYG